MVTHTVYHQNINDSIRVELVYENYPVIAGTDELSLVLRFRYIGPLNNNAVPKSSKKAEHDSPSQNDGWFGSRLSSQFSNATRALFLQQLNTMPEEENDVLQDISIYLGYVQLFGYYSINDRIVDASIFEELQKSATFEGRLAGINGLEITFDQHKRGLLTGLTTLFQPDMNDEHIHIIPHYSTTQSILFSDLTFKPTQLNSNSTSTKLTRSFYVNMKLPMDLAPSFRSEAVQIHYNVILGYQLKETNGTFSNKTMFFPLKIQPYIDRFGRQPLFHLERQRMNQRPSALKNIDLNIAGSSEIPAQPRHVRKYSEPDINGKSTRRSSNASSLPNNLSKKPSTINMEFLRRSLATADSTRRSSSEDLPATFDLSKDLETKQFLALLNELNESDVMDAIKLQEKFEKQYHHGQDAESNPRQNLFNIIQDYHSVQKQEFYSADDVADMEGQVPVHQQTKYIVKQDHLQLANLTLSKNIVRVGDDITISMSFADAQLETKGVEVRLIKDQVFYRDEYLRRYEYNEVYKGIKHGNSMETTVFHKPASTFDAEQLNVNVQVPATVEPQFKTNFFQLKYLVQIKFVLVDAYKLTRSPEESTQKNREVFDLTSIFTDNKGSVLYKAVEGISNGLEFTVRLPIVVLPSYEYDIAP
ncbi:hypothetical protein KL906_000782 [Ogataea polymorpha]|uniref:Uncharacterized protein n=1 Tax=Ogataea polymorpha TaxID=460523 RepID=A0A9P8P0V2_9ASCO|nr:hypothetical protein KL906_000782 [Ogataea polymorpha]KAG7919320.1 hypothetical protein KL927_001449 [Ogataea polymorpha]KAG7937122.1 hypothetical protein KL934_001325 [Ogataea polymorpha]KAH3663040.1 hypothetical protein OGATHE_004616 [Ogataea polymorpha]